MGFLDKIFRKPTNEEVKQQEKIEEITKKGIDPQAPLVENKVICNACGQEIDQGIPRFINHQGRRMVFHKRCLKKLKSGNLQF